VRLLEFFSDKPQKETEPEQLDPRGNPHTSDSTLRFTSKQLNLSSLMNFIKNYKEKLSSNRDIIIKEADKGHGVVIMDTDRYIREGQRQLNYTLSAS
jgi:hypothetical protein